jgi:hypothetical protein
MLHLFLAVCIPVVCSTSAPKHPADDHGYKQFVIEGFLFLVSDEVLREGDKLQGKQKPLVALDTELSALIKELPPRSVDALRKIPVHVDWQVGGSHGVCGSSSHTGRNGTIRTSAITITNGSSRGLMLHEFSHAIHYQAFAGRDAVVKAAYTSAMAKGLYKDCYAHTNESEYFSEISCAYFNYLNYKPHTRQELKEYDPVGYSLMELTWGTPEAIEREKKPFKEKSANAKLTLANSLLHAPSRHKEALELLQSVVDQYPDTRAAKAAK